MYLTVCLGVVCTLSAVEVVESVTGKEITV
jgi:hypothetical protein